MNFTKRQGSSIEFIDIQAKKFRNELLLSPNSRLENLSNELFYEIFDYLDGYDVYNAFSSLNIRFQNLLTSSSIPIKINLNPKSQLSLEQRCQQFIIPNQHRILSLHLRDDSLVNNFLKYCIIDSSFNRLESIILGELTDRKLLWTLFHLNSLPRLFSLTITLEEDDYYNLGDIYRLIFSLPNLKYNKLSLLGYEELDIVVPRMINGKTCSITHLVIDFSCTIEQLASLLYHTPQLSHLVCEGLIEADEKIKKDFPVTLSHLTHFSMGECRLEFDEFEMIIKKLSSQLQVLKVNTLSNTTYLDANRWERLIKKHTPHLNKLYFTYNQYIDGNFSEDPGCNFMQRFTSSFWMERKWSCELKLIHQSSMKFLVHPLRKEWFDIHEYNVDNSCILLTIEPQKSIERTRLFIDKMKSSCATLRLTHLNINCKDISMGMLTEIIRLLPNLDTLQISSLSIEDIQKHYLLTTMNKITKVKLDMVTKENQIQCVIHLCPRIQYLELDCISNTNLQRFAKYILLNQMTNIPNLQSICFNIPNADEMMVRNLGKTIELETLIDSYTIQRINSKILLQWKLS